MKRYRAQRMRGTDGFGFYIPETNRLTHNTKEGRTMSLLRREKEASEILFHHRMPTSTINVRNACHPFSTKDYFENNYVVVHNGVLHNELTLKREHDDLGITYISEQEDGSFNDSEALTYDIARYLEGHTTELTASGSIAFIAIKRDSTGKAVALFFGRNGGNPLMIKHTKFSITISSEGDGTPAEINQLYCYIYDTGELTKTPLTIPYTSYSSGYRYGSWDDDYRQPYVPYRSYESTKADLDDVALAATSTQSPDYAHIYDIQVQARVEKYKADAKHIAEDAITLCERDLIEHRWRVKQIVDKYDDASNEATEEEISIYCELEETVGLLEDVMKRLQEDYAGKPPIGFLTQSTLPTT